MSHKYGLIQYIYRILQLKPNNVLSSQSLHLVVYNTYLIRTQKMQFLKQCFVSWFRMSTISQLFVSSCRDSS